MTTNLHSVFMHILESQVLDKFSFPSTKLLFCIWSNNPGIQGQNGARCFISNSEPMKKRALFSTRIQYMITQAENNSS